jgi:predicted transcriptional regulator
MVSKRKYKTLSTAQSAKVKRYTKQGKSQQAIAKLLHVSKQRVSSAQAKAKVGKRAPSTFWKDVKNLKGMGYSHKEATEVVKYSPKWKKAYKKRTGKARLHWKDKDEIRYKLRAAYEELDEEQKMQGIEYEGETYYETPK